MADDEESLLERQLELQLEEQRESLDALNEALSSDPTNLELLAVHDELVEAIKGAEEGLFHLKRARLLQEADVALQTSTRRNVEAEPFEVEEVEAEPLKEYTVGSKCRFRHSDGRWHNGLIIQLEGSDAARVSFLTPTSEKMLMCRFFLQQRCRFGTNCRLSHGFDLPITSLKKYTPMTWDQSLVGSTIWATSDSKPGIWREAELESWDEILGLGQVVFRDDRTSLKLGPDSISLSEFALMSSDEEEEEEADLDSDAHDSENERAGGLGFIESSKLRRGIQGETAIFAKWENHTRGIASKMMADMGYREGMGLGISGQGMINPISVKVLPPKQSLDLSLGCQDNEVGGENLQNKRSRGGRRKRDRKFAEKARAAKAEEESSPNLFTFINTQLGGPGEAELEKKSRKCFEEGKKNDRKALVAYEDEVRELKLRVEKLEEMVSRNKREKAVYEAALRKLNETREALAEVEAAQASASNAVVRGEREKRWLKF